MGGHSIHHKQQVYDGLVGWLGSMGFDGEERGKHTTDWRTAKSKEQRK